MRLCPCSLSIPGGQIVVSSYTLISVKSQYTVSEALSHHFLPHYQSAFPTPAPVPRDPQAEAGPVSAPLLVH